MLVNAQGQVLLDGEIIEINEISRIVREKIQANPNLVISLKTDKETRYEDYVHVLDQLKEAEAKKISIAEPDED